jgi:hypothetical protein
VGHLSKVSLMSVYELSRDLLLRSHGLIILDKQTRYLCVCVGTVLFGNAITVTRQTFGKCTRVRMFAE